MNGAAMLESMNEVLQQYDAELRRNPTGAAGMCVVRDAHVTGLEGGFNYVCSWSFSEEVTARVVSEQARHFRQIGKELMSRVYEHDKPSNIEACLDGEGFVPSSSGTLMVLALEGYIPVRTEHDIRRVTSSTERASFFQSLRKSLVAMMPA
jgi:hypothetical protein